MALEKVQLLYYTLALLTILTEHSYLVHATGNQATATTTGDDGSAMTDRDKSNLLTMRLFRELSVQPETVSTPELKQLRASLPQRIRRKIELINMGELTTVGSNSFPKMNDSILFGKQKYIGVLMFSVQCKYRNLPISCFVFEFDRDLIGIPTALSEFSVKVASNMWGRQLGVYAIPEILPNSHNIEQLGRALSGQTNQATSVNGEVNLDITSSIRGIFESNLLPLQLIVGIVCEDCTSGSQTIERVARGSKTRAVIDIQREVLQKVPDHQRRRKRLFPEFKRKCPFGKNIPDIFMECCLVTETFDLTKGTFYNFNIIAPNEMPINLCFGTCPLTAQSGGYHTEIIHSLLLHMTATEQRRLDKYMPCCAAQKTAPLIMLYIDKWSRATMRSFENAVVTECACR